VGSALDAAGSVDEVEENVGCSGSELGVELTAGQRARSVAISRSISAMRTSSGSTGLDDGARGGGEGAGAVETT
jgi:hypothetical protein